MKDPNKQVYSVVQETLFPMDFAGRPVNTPTGTPDLLANYDPRRSKLLSGVLAPSMDAITSVMVYQGAGDNYSEVDRTIFGATTPLDWVQSFVQQEIKLQNYQNIWNAQYAEVRLRKITIEPVITCDTYVPVQTYNNQPNNTVPDIGTIPTKPVFCHQTDTTDQQAPENWNLFKSVCMKQYNNIGKKPPTKTITPYTLMVTLAANSQNQVEPDEPVNISNICIYKNLSKIWMTNRNAFSGGIFPVTDQRGGNDFTLPKYKWMIYNFPPFARIAFRVKHYIDYRRLRPNPHVVLNEGLLGPCHRNYREIVFRDTVENEWEDCPTGSTGGTGEFMDEESSQFQHDAAGLRIEPIPGPVGWDKPLIPKPPCKCHEIQKLLLAHRL